MKPQFSFREIAPLFFTIIVDIMGFGLAFPVLVPLFNASPSPLFATGTPDATRLFMLGLAFTIYPFFMFFGSAFLGDLSDVIGRKKVLLTSMLGVCSGFACMGLGVTFGSLILLLIGRGISGLFAGSQPAALAAIADLSVTENKAKNMAYIALANSLGFVLGPALGGLLTSPKIAFFFSYSTPFYFSAILAILMVIWLFFGFSETYTSEERKHIDLLRCFKVFADAIRHPRIRVLSLAFFLMQLGLSFFIQLILIYLQTKYHYTAADLGLYNGALGVAFSVSLLFLVPFFTKKYALSPLITTFLFITALFLFGISLIQYELATWIIGLFFGLANQVAYAGMFACFSNAVTEKEQGWAMGIISSTIAATFAIAGFETNLIPHFGILPLIFFGACVFTLSAFTMLYYTKRNRATG